MMEKELIQMRVNGGCVVEGVVPEDQVGAVGQSVLESVEQHGRPEPRERGIGHVSGFIACDQSLAPYLADSRLMGIAEALLGKHVRISMVSATINLPGNKRGVWHADWPFNQNNAGHIPAPYPDVVAHLTTLWMLSPFSSKNGGTLIMPGSHRADNNPTGNNGIDPMDSLPGELQAVGEAGSVLMIDSRLWHSSAPNITDEPRVSVVIRYAPWWLNTNVLMPGSVERAQMVDETGAAENEVPPVPQEVYDCLPEDVKPLFRHWVR